MQTLTTTAPVSRPATPRGLVLRLIRAIDRAHRRHREAHHLGALDADRLTDVGISRAELDAEFLGRFAYRDQRGQPSIGW